MPIAYLDVPEGLDVGGKRELVKELYEALSHAYPFPERPPGFLAGVAARLRQSEWCLGIRAGTARIHDPRPPGCGWRC